MGAKNATLGVLVGEREGWMDMSGSERESEGGSTGCERERDKYELGKNEWEG